MATAQCRRKSLFCRCKRALATALRRQFFRRRWWRRQWYLPRQFAVARLLATAKRLPSQEFCDCKMPSQIPMATPPTATEVFCRRKKSFATAKMPSQKYYLWIKKNSACKCMPIFFFFNEWKLYKKEWSLYKRKCYTLIFLINVTKWMKLLPKFTRSIIKLYKLVIIFL